MPHAIRKTVLFIFLFLAIASEATERYLPHSLWGYWAILIMLAATASISFRLEKQLAPTLFFFTLLHACRPVNVAFTQWIGAAFNGTYFLIPTLIYTLFILFFPGVKNTIDWWKKESISTALLGQMILAIGVSGLAMYVYLIYHSDSIDRFLKMLPDGSWWWIVAMGLAYALLNAVVEEYIIRGMFWNGLAKLIRQPWLIVWVQAAVFGLSHYWGLPGGWPGAFLVFGWSVYMGYVRQKTGGLRGVILLHFGANLVQYFILLGFR
jgi:membrane protease YdiL (CAAX protease family)